MKILVSITSGSNNIERNVLRSFYDGIERYYFEKFNTREHKILKKEHGIDLRLNYDPEIERCDVAVQFGTVKDRGVEHHITRKSIREKSKHVVFVETPLLGRTIVKNSEHSYYRVGVDGFLNNDGFFYHEKTFDTTRIHKLKNNGLDIKNFTGWKNHTQGNILILLQLPGDASLRGQKHGEWFIDTVRKIRAITSRPITVRFHPAMSDKGRAEFFSEINSFFFYNFKDIRWSTGLDKTLDAEFNDSGICVSYTSGSCIDAVLAGVPVIAMDEGNLAYNISSRLVEDINNPRLASTDEVFNWINKLANSQWSEQEMLAGTTWSNIVPIIEDLLNEDSNSLS